MQMVLHLVRVAILTAAALAWRITGSFALAGICRTTHQAIQTRTVIRGGSHAITKPRVKNIAKRAPVYTRGELANNFSKIFAGTKAVLRVKSLSDVIIQEIITVGASPNKRLEACNTFYYGQTRLHFTRYLGDSGLMLVWQ